MEEKYHEHQNSKPFQKIGTKDEEFRKELILNYSLLECNQEFLCNQHLGFDGRFNYKFRVEDDFSKGPSNVKREKYKTYIVVEKSGNKKDSGKTCDLEEFLLEKGFEKVKNSK